MEAHAAAMQPAGRSVLNVGFGLGLIDRCLQSRRPKAHDIVECHPDVLAAMQQEGWASKPGVRILQGRWQDVLPGGATYDAIFWDTFGESVDELVTSHSRPRPHSYSHSHSHSHFHIHTSRPRSCTGRNARRACEGRRDAGVPLLLGHLRSGFAALVAHTH